MSGQEAHLGAPPVVDFAEFLQRAHGMAALVDLAIELAVARHLDFEPRRQRIDDRYADAMQAARGLVDLGVELSAGMQRGHDDLERRAVGVFRMRVDRNAAAIVGDGEIAAGFQRDLDEIRVAGDGLVHGVVDHLGEEVVHRLLVGAADIHARTPAHRLQPLQNLDVGCGIACLRRPWGRRFRRRQRIGNFRSGRGPDGANLGGRASGEEIIAHDALQAALLEWPLAG